MRLRLTLTAYYKPYQPLEMISACASVARTIRTFSASIAAVVFFAEVIHVTTCFRKLPTMSLTFFFLGPRF